MIALSANVPSFRAVHDCAQRKRFKRVPPHAASFSAAMHHLCLSSYTRWLRIGASISSSCHIVCTRCIALQQVSCLIAYKLHSSCASAGLRILSYHAEPCRRDLASVHRMARSFCPDALVGAEEQHYVRLYRMLHQAAGMLTSLPALA